MNDPLSKFQVLDELGEVGREHLFELLEPKSLADGFVLFQQGQEASDLMFLTSGRVALRRGKHEIGRMGSGEIIGGASLVLIGKHECDATAVESCELLVLSREAYLRLRADYPSVALDLQEAILRGFAASLRTLLPDLI